MSMGLPGHVVVVWLAVFQWTYQKKEDEQKRRLAWLSDRKVQEEKKWKRRMKEEKEGDRETFAFSRPPKGQGN